MITAFFESFGGLAIGFLGASLAYRCEFSVFDLNPPVFDYPVVRHCFNFNVIDFHN